MNLHQLMFKSHSSRRSMTAVLERTESLLLALETIYLKNYGIYKENIDQINTTGHV